jgi:hypothetical protein
MERAHQGPRSGVRRSAGRRLAPAGDPKRQGDGACPSVWRIARTPGRKISVHAIRGIRRAAEEREDSL